MREPQVSAKAALMSQTLFADMVHSSGCLNLFVCARRTVVRLGSGIAIVRAWVKGIDVLALVLGLEPVGLHTLLLLLLVLYK